VGVSSDPRGVRERHQLEEAVLSYLQAHGRWINGHWEPHHTPPLSRSERERRARLARKRRKAQRA
jgi:hypothetical protein